MSNDIPWYLWPVKAVSYLLAFVIILAGRIVTTAIGIVLMSVGILLTVSIVAAPVGVPLAVIGLLLIIRGLF